MVMSHLRDYRCIYHNIQWPIMLCVQDRPIELVTIQDQGLKLSIVTFPRMNIYCNTPTSEFPYQFTFLLAYIVRARIINNPILPTSSAVSSRRISTKMNP
jgi:hypothetical protein